MNTRKKQKEADKTDKVELRLKAYLNANDMAMIEERLGRQISNDDTINKVKVGLWNKHREELGFRIYDGNEATFLRQLGDKPLLSLEKEESAGFYTPEMQLSNLRLIKKMVRNWEKEGERKLEILDIWRKGDAELAKASFERDLAENGLVFIEVVCYQRNKVFAESLSAKNNRYQTIFAAVGYGHLDGDKSVIHYLKQAGYHVVETFPKKWFQ